RKTAGDVTSLARSARNLDNSIAGVNHIAIAELQVRVLGNRVAAQLVARFIQNVDVGMQTGALVANHANAFNTSGVIELGDVGYAFLQLVELDLAAVAGDDERVVRI